MSLKDSTDLIQRKESFSDGVSMKNFMTQWDPHPPEAETTTGNEKIWEFFWKSRESGLEDLYFGNTVIQETSEKKCSEQELFLNRILCHLVVNRIPDECLPDLIDSLKDVYQFHQNWAGSSQVRQLETTDPIQAQIVSEYDRETVSYEES